MADSTTNLDTISSGQASKEVTANALFDAMSANALYGRRASTTAALTWGYYGGHYARADGTITAIANGTIALSASLTNYILDTDGVVSKVIAAPAGWPGPLAGGAVALYAVVCDGSGVTSYTDYRTRLRGPKGDTGATGATGAAGATGAPGANGAPGADASTVFDALAFYPGLTAASAVVLRVPVARAISFAANFAGSYGKASANATASTAFDIQKNGASVGTATFALGAASCTFVSSGGAPVAFAPGDVLSIIAPASPDATLADPGFVLAGTR